MISKNSDNWTITVKNVQSVDNMQDTVTERGIGTYREKDGIIYITYKTEDASVLIKAGNNTIKVKRMGSAKSDMDYVLAEETEFLYRTPYGIIDMSIFTQNIFIDADENGGKISLEYILSTGEDKMTNKMTIRVERQKDL